jgi:hypothetical protein
MRYVILVSILLITTPQERVNLTNPIAKPSISNYTISYLALDWSNQRVTIELLANNGERLSKVYDSTTNPTGNTIMTGLNTANLTTRSLNQRVFDRLIQDKVIEGTVTGVSQ